MELQIELWSEAFAAKLREAFGPNLKFVGVQGSYARGEATPQSDIDMVTVLERVTTGDLKRYRQLVSEMPGGDLACGFLCGKEELYHWPKYDLYGLLLDTRPIWGNLQDWLPELTAGDAWEALQIGASNLYHAACHTYLYHRDPRGKLGALGKSAFFCLRLSVLLRDGIYHPSKRELLPALDGPEREILLYSMNPEKTAAFSEQETERAYSLLLQWCGDLLRHGRKPYGPAGEG